MAQLSYDIVPRNGGWGILLTPGPREAFATRQQAFDAAAALAHKLRFAGVRINVRMDDTPPRKAASQRRA
jgi:hypothetical protein